MKVDFSSFPTRHTGANLGKYVESYSCSKLEVVHRQVADSISLSLLTLFVFGPLLPLAAHLNCLADYARPLGLSPLYICSLEVVKIRRFDIYEKEELILSHLNSLLLIFDLANQSGVQVSLNLA